MLPSSITVFQWTLKDLIILLLTTNHIYMYNLTLSVTLLLQYRSNQITQRLLSKLFYTIGLLNLDHPYILPLIVDQNMLKKNWHTFVHLWEFATLQEQLTLLGQMASSKYKIETLVHIYECFYMTHLKIGHSKSICTLMHIIHNHFQKSVSLLMKLFFTPDPESPSRSI